MRKSYTQEQKLQAIQYAITTVVIRNKKPQIITQYKASGKLGITLIVLKKWIESKETIASQSKAFRRAKFKVQLSQEPEMEQHLVKLFTSAYASGQMIGGRQFERHAKALYKDLYPHQVIQVNRRFQYLGFKFSNAWFQGFRHQFSIANRSKTKQAQKTPKAFRKKVISQLQFN